MVPIRTLVQVPLQGIEDIPTDGKVQKNKVITLYVASHTCHKKAIQNCMFLH